MAFGICRKELNEWKRKVQNGEIAFLTHYWQDKRFPGCSTVTKVGCKDIDKLARWGESYGLKREWIHERDKYPHFDLFGEIQKKILIKEKQHEQMKRFQIK